jgi:4-hydroxybenzoate polyprenyltransferase
VKLIDLVFFARPMLVIPVWTVYLHFFATETSAGYASVLPDRTSIIHLIALTLIFKGTYVFNQLFDIESDRINDKLFFLPRGIISTTTAWIYYVVLSLAGILVIIFLDPDAIRPVAAIVILGILYSVPGVRLKDSPFGGLIANAVAYGLLIPWMISDLVSGEYPVTGMIPYFLAIAAGYVLTTIPDHDGDLATGKRTMAVILGPRGALWLTLLTVLATVGASISAGNSEMAIVAGLTLVGVVSLLISFKYRLLMLTCKMPILLLTLVAGAHYLFYPGLLLLTIILTRLYYKRRFGIVYPELS